MSKRVFIKTNRSNHHDPDLSVLGYGELALRVFNDGDEALFFQNTDDELLSLKPRVNMLLDDKLNTTGLTYDIALSFNEDPNSITLNLKKYQFTRSDEELITYPVTLPAATTAKAGLLSASDKVRLDNTIVKNNPDEQVMDGGIRMNLLSVDGVSLLRDLYVGNNEKANIVLQRRNGANFISASNGTICFAANQNNGFEFGNLTLDNGLVYGKDNYISLGASSYRWKNVYTHLLDVAGLATMQNVTASGSIIAAGSISAQSGNAGADSMGSLFDAEAMWLELGTDDDSKKIHVSHLEDVYTKSETDARIASIVSSAPETLDTLNELAAALGDDPNFAATMATELGKKANKATTLAGYNIGDAYTKSEVDGKIQGYLPLSGGTLSGNSNKPLSVNATLNNVYVEFKLNGVHKGLVGHDSYGVVLRTSSDNRLGIKDDGTPHYNGQGLIHSGNIASQSVASAGKLTTLRKLWGQDFDGSANVEGRANFYGEAVDTQRFVRAAITIREANKVGNTQLDDKHAPRIGFFWSDVTGSHIIIDKNGDFKFTNYNENGYRNLYANNVYGTLKGNADSASKLTTSRVIFGANFDGTTDISGGGIFYGKASEPGQSYNNSGVQIREADKVLNTQNSDKYAPRLSFHWAERFGHSIIANAGCFKLQNLSETGYVDLYAKDVYANLIGNATTATKLGTSTVGSSVSPVYISAGSPVAMTPYTRWRQFNYGNAPKGSYAMAMGRNANAIGDYAIASGANSFAGIRWGEGSTDYVYWKEWNTELFDVTVTPAADNTGFTETVIEGTAGIYVPIKSTAQIRLTVSGTTYTLSYDNSAGAYNRVLVIINDPEDVIVAKDEEGFRRCAVTYNGRYDIGRGRYVLSVKTDGLPAGYKLIEVYTWSANNTIVINFGTKASAFLATKTTSSDYSSNQSNASGYYSVASGYSSVASGYSSVASGSYSVASGYSSVASGSYSVASGSSSVASGYSSVASGSSSVASGYSSVASGSYSVASGSYSVASGYSSVASGYSSVASGSSSVASGYSSVASGSYSVASGYYSVASGSYSVASGSYSVASGSSSVASGYSSVASGSYSVASGYYSVAKHNYAQVLATRGVSGREHQTVIGQWNAESSSAVFVIGFGNSSTRKNIFEVMTGGTVQMAGDIYLENNKRLRIKDNTGALRDAVSLNSNNDFALGYGTSLAGYRTELFGNDIRFYTGTSPKQAMTIDSSGNVGIGTATPSAKLHVKDGLVSITNSGYTLTLGSKNESYCHIATTAPVFYFNKDIDLDGIIKPYKNNSTTSGLDTHRWSNVYSVLLNASGLATLSGGISTTIIDASQTISCRQLNVVANGVSGNAGWSRGLGYTVIHTDGTQASGTIAAAYGNGSALNYLYYGGTYSAPWLKLTSDSLIMNGAIEAKSLKLTSYRINSDFAMRFVKPDGSAQKINIGGLLVSSAYADASKIPTYGVYSKGDVITAGSFLPENSGTQSIGSASKGFDTVYADNLSAGSVKFLGFNRATMGVDVLTSLNVDGDVVASGAISSQSGNAMAATLSDTAVTDSNEIIFYNRNEASLNYLSANSTVDLALGELDAEVTLSFREWGASNVIPSVGDIEIELAAAHGNGNESYCYINLPLATTALAGLMSPADKRKVNSAMYCPTIDLREIQQMIDSGFTLTRIEMEGAGFTTQVLSDMQNGKVPIVKMIEITNKSCIYAVQKVSDTSIWIGTSGFDSDNWTMWVIDNYDSDAALITFYEI